jgi:hypothetical protein
VVREADEAAHRLVDTDVHLRGGGWQI